MAVSILAEGLRDAERFFASLPDIATTAARLSLNQTADRKGTRMIREAMREQIAFPNGYLESDQRLGVTQLATDQRLQVAITGRQRPTSLARFATSGSPNTPKAPVILRVNPGRTQTLDRAFLLRLRGAADSFNLGLAIRLRPGERIANKNIQMQRMSANSNLYLLYGPSVDQVFRDVAVEVAPRLLEETSDEFLRQIVRLMGR